MNDVPDLLERGPRLRRVALAFAVGVVMAAIVGVICYGVAAHDAEVHDVRTAGYAWKLIFFMAALGGAASFSLTLFTLTRHARGAR
jgi:hypothetical protein